MRSVCALTAAILAALCASPALAVVVRGGSANALVAPADGFVGRWNGSSGVAIGRHWAITARHNNGAAGQMFRMDDRDYAVDAIFRHPSADLMLVRTREEMSGWVPITRGVTTGRRVLLGGMGRTAGREAAGAGYDWTGRYAETWGENTIEWTGRNQFAMRYDVNRAAMAREAGFAMNDSGGGVFTVLPDGSLSLAGVAFQVSRLNYTGAGTWSYAIDLRNYFGWISSLIGDDALAPAAFGDDGQRAGAAIPAPATGGVLLALIGACGVMRRRR